jgi:hypothetical protein
MTKNGKMSADILAVCVARAAVASEPTGFKLGHDTTLPRH